MMQRKRRKMISALKRNLPFYAEQDREDTTSQFLWGMSIPREGTTTQTMGTS